MFLWRVYYHQICSLIVFLATYVVVFNFNCSNAAVGWTGRCSKEVQIPKEGQGDVLWEENAETGMEL